MNDKITRLKRLWHTVKYLKPTQIFYRVIFKFKGKVPYKALSAPQNSELKLQDLINTFPYKYIEKNTFEFLNLKKSFPHQIDWEFSDYGRLWTYNLNYFEYLLQDNISEDEVLELLNDYITHLPQSKTGIEPYPLSLKIIFWSQYLIKFRIDNPQINNALYSQLILLTKKLEYHLLGNHLLENAFALLYGAYYFHEEKIYKKAKRILEKELKEQILPDGAHFELSPMYHGIMLHRMLDCYNLIKNNDLFEKNLGLLFKTKSEQMLAWMNRIKFDNGDIPLVNDAALNIAPNSGQLNQYAARLGLDISFQNNLKESGYRTYKNNKFELLIDIGKIGPDYQPGHAHADTLSFELYINNRPVLVETGTSTYEVNETRFYERSTIAHNTVVIDGKNSSEVWGGHRVGKRAKVSILEEKEDFVKAVHDGYSTPHERSWDIENEKIIISDKIQGKGIAYFHFFPDENIRQTDIIQGKDFIIRFQNAQKIELFESYYAPEFNTKIPRVSARVFFTNELVTYIQ